MQSIQHDPASPNILAALYPPLHVPETLLQLLVLMLLHLQLPLPSYTDGAPSFSISCSGSGAGESLDIGTNS